MSSVPVYWNRCEGDVWGELYALNLTDPHFDNLEGVYMVWIGGSKPAAICAGSGLIREKLTECRESPELMALREQSLLVSWAKADELSRAGIERWLLETLRPQISNYIPDALPLEVNLPGRPSQAAPDAGAPPTQIFENQNPPETALPSTSSADPSPAEAAPPAAPRLQAEFIELLTKAKATEKGGGKTENEKLLFDIVQRILHEAVKLRASDVHLEPLGSFLRVRFRVDGMLEEMLRIPSALNLRVVSHVRVMCGLDPERDIGASKPEEARISFPLSAPETDLRLTTFPTTNGDKAVLHLFPLGAQLRSIDELGLETKTADALREVITRPQGMIIATGPAGSGKSTTLYALLQKINLPSRNIETLEDQVKVKITGISQGMVPPKAGFGFADGLRAILRQDPNVIMVGEIYDSETAALTLSASLTGRMIFTTLRTAGALEAITSLLDMGLEPFLISSALTAVTAQRLARRICPDCAQPYKPDAAEAAEIERRAKRGGFRFSEKLIKNLKRGSGCEACRHSGCLGRVLLFEYVPITPTLRALILKKASLDDLRAASLKDGNEPLISDGLRKAAEGVTSISEVFRVVDSID